MFKNFIAVAPQASAMHAKACQLAERLQLDLITDLKTADYEHILLCETDRLSIYPTSNKQIHPLSIDFLVGKMRYRSQQAGLRSELIARAIGCKPTEQPTIIDATAGLGRDSFILASLGFEVTLVERSPVLHALLDDALQRSRHEPFSQRMHLVLADAIDWLPTVPSFDVIYLDPMFPTRQKSASVKKDMALLQALLGKDNDATRLFEVALGCAKKRVVVKRPKLADNIGDQVPNYTLAGKSSRFDIYLT
jgi:16S rRNA (guanine1516-N2)-methyltransferase